SASASLEGSFLDWPMRMPTCLDRLFRAERSSWASAMTARFSLSSSSTSSTRGSFWSWNFFLMFSFTRSGFSRISLMSSILEHSLNLIIMCWFVGIGEGRFHVKHGFSFGGFRRLRAASDFLSDEKVTNGPGHLLLPLWGNSP